MLVGAALRNVGRVDSRASTSKCPAHACVKTTVREGNCYHYHGAGGLLGKGAETEAAGSGWTDALIYQREVHSKNKI